VQQDNLCPVEAEVVDALRKSLLRICSEEILSRLPYGSIIVAKIHDGPGIHTLIKTDQDEWHDFTVYGDPDSWYGIDTEDPMVPALPAVLVSCGDQLPEEEEKKRKFVLIQGELSDTPVQ
jgi:hypothetical protein